MFLFLTQAAAEAAEGSSGGMLADIPHDAAAIVIYLLLALAIGWVVVAGRRKDGPGGE